jgi:tetratricopeptide (TPR) repeat protein
MSKAFRFLVLLGLMMLLVPAGARASGGSSMPPPGGMGPSSMQPPPQKSPQQQAIDFYNAGLKHRDKALDYLKEADQAGSDKERAKLEGKANKEFEKAIEQYRMATKMNPQFYQASSDLGFALRKTGEYALALESYNRALSLAANYTPAIEYRAEAYLGLDRTDEAKEAYMQLFTADRSRADELMASMKRWVEKRKADPGKLTPEAVQGFAGWVSERDEIARQTPTVSELQNRKW